MAVIVGVMSVVVISRFVDVMRRERIGG